MRISDWSSDVCSSDLAGRRRLGRPSLVEIRGRPRGQLYPASALLCRIDPARPASAPRKPRVNARRPDTDRARLRTAETAVGADTAGRHLVGRSEEHTSELQSLMRISYAVFCLKKKKKK